MDTTDERPTTGWLGVIMTKPHLPVNLFLKVGPRGSTLNTTGYVRSDRCSNKFLIRSSTLSINVINYDKVLERRLINNW